MLSAEKCLQILNSKGKKYNIEEATEISQILYTLAEIEFSNYQNSKSDVKGDNLHKGING